MTSMIKEFNDNSKHLDRCNSLSYLFAKFTKISQTWNGDGTVVEQVRNMV